LISPGKTSSDWPLLDPSQRRRAWAAWLEVVFQDRDSEAAGRSTTAGLFVPSPLSDLRPLFDQIDLAAYKRMADLGSGDGRVVLLAALYTDAEGLEADPALVAASRGCALALGISRARFARIDFQTADLKKYDLLFIYPDKPLGPLTDRLTRDFAGDLLVYGPFPSAGDLKETARFDLKFNQARLFRRG